MASPVTDFIYSLGRLFLLDSPGGGATSMTRHSAEVGIAEDTAASQYRLRALLDGRTDLSPDQRDILLHVAHDAAEDPDRIYTHIIQMALDGSDPERQRQALIVLRPVDEDFAVHVLNWLLQLIVPTPPTAHTSDLAAAQGLFRLAAIQKLVARLSKGDWNLSEAASWQSALSLDEIFAVAATLTNDLSAQWLCALLLGKREETAELISVRLKKFVESLPQSNKDAFGQEFNLALHNEILRQRSLSRQTLNPDDPLVKRPTAYLDLDIPTRFSLSRHPDPYNSEIAWNDLFPEQAIFMTAPASYLWAYVAPGEPQQEPHPLPEVRRRAIEYLELSGLGPEDAQSLIELAEHYYRSGKTPEIKRETKMLLDVLSTLDNVSEVGPNPAYSYVRGLIDYELELLEDATLPRDVEFMEKRKFSVNRFVRSAMMIDPVATFHDLPRWQRALKNVDADHYEKFGELHDQLFGMLYEKLPPRLASRLQEKGLKNYSNTSVWFSAFSDPADRTELYHFLTDCFSDKVQLGESPADKKNNKLNHGSVAVTALKLMTVLGDDYAVPVVLKELDDQIEHLLEQVSPPKIPHVSPNVRYRELTAWKDLNYVRFLLNAVGRIGNPGVTALHLRRMREKYLGHYYFGNNNLDAQFGRTISMLENKGGNGHRFRGAQSGQTGSLADSRGREGPVLAKVLARPLGSSRFADRAPIQIGVPARLHRSQFRLPEPNRK